MANDKANERMKPEDYLGKDMSGFQVTELIELFRIDIDGRYTKNICYLRDGNIAGAFLLAQRDNSYCRTQKVFALSDGKIGFILGEAIELASDEATAIEVKLNALSKLTTEERRVLGI